MISKENIFLVAKNILNGIWTQEAIQNIQIQSITQMLCLWYFFWNRWESLRNIHKKIKIKDRLNNFNEISPFLQMCDKAAADNEEPGNFAGPAPVCGHDSCHEAYIGYILSPNSREDIISAGLTC